MRLLKASSNMEANFLLGFSYHEDEPLDGTGSYSTSYNRKRRAKRGNQKSYRPLKDYSVQSAFKFIVRAGGSTENDYMLNLFDPNETVEWRDVVQVIFNMINARDVQCPICLENLP
jgi:hypothetical protein